MSAVDVFRKVIKGLIDKKIVKKSEIHKKTGIARNLIDGYLEDKDIDLSRAEQIAHACGYSLVDILKNKPLPPPPKPRDPTPLEVAEYLFEHGAPNVDPRAMQLFKKAISADESQLAVLETYVDAMFEESVDDADTGATS